MRPSSKASFIRTSVLLCTALIQSTLGGGFAIASDGGGTTEPTVNRPIKDKWAVVIGVSKFADPVIPTLRYPAKDAQDFYDFLVTRANFQKDHVLLLKNEQATKVRILDAFGDGWLPRRVMKDDLVVIYLSTHGSPADVAGENFVVAYDSDPEHMYATGIRFQDLSSEVIKRTGCDRLIMLLDACHSGSAVAEQKGLQRSSSNFNLESITGTGQLVISSSAPAEVSWESKRYPNGVFTRKLIESLQINGEGTRVNDAFEKLKESVEQEVRFDRITDQTPLILSRWNGQDLAFCAPPAEPRKVLATVETLGSQYTSPNTFDIDKKPALVTKKTFTTISTNMPPLEKSARNGLLQKPMMTGSWTTPEKDVTLEETTRLLDENELAALSSKELLCIYNEAYARHGRGFSLPLLQKYFSEQTWYKVDPDYHWRTDDPKVVARKGELDDALVVNFKRTPKQWQNMQTIKRIMENAKR